MASAHRQSPFDPSHDPRGSPRLAPAMRGAAASHGISNQQPAPLQSRAYHGSPSPTPYNAGNHETFDSVIGNRQAPPRPLFPSPAIQPDNRVHYTTTDSDNVTPGQDSNVGVSTDKGYFSNVEPEPVKRSKRRCCGCCCCGGRVCALIIFVILSVLAVAGYFLWPRMPGVEIEAISANANGGGPGGFSIEPGRYGVSQPISIIVAAKSENWIPWRFTSVTAEIKDTANGQYLGEVSARNVVMAARDISHVGLTGKLEYRTSNATDPTWRRLVGACSGARSDLSIRVIIHVELPLLRSSSQPSFEQPAVWKCPNSVAVQDPLLS